MSLLVLEPAEGAPAVPTTTPASPASLVSPANASSAASAASAVSAASGWERLPAVLARIVAPVFPERAFDVTKFGAVGDGVTDGSTALREAIAACAAAGGGRVVVPAGVFLTGPVHLKSGVNLHVVKGATLRFSAKPADYLPAVLTRWEGVECMNYSPLIYALDQENIAITGGGVLDGGAAAGRWWDWKGPWGGREPTGWAPGKPEQRVARARLFKLAADEVPVTRRVFGEGDYLRPNFVQPYRCRNVLIEGVTLINSPMWVLNPVLCRNVIVRGVTIESHGPNNDGCDPESCTDVLIEGCSFNTGDDCIAIKSGRDADGRRLATPSENIVVRDCTMKDGHGGVVIGSEISGNVRNVWVERCRMDSPHLDRALRIKSNSNRGGHIEGIYVRDVTIGRVAQAVVGIDLRYDKETGPRFPRVRDIELRGVTCETASRVLWIEGLPEEPVSDLRLIDCTFRAADQANIVNHVAGLTVAGTVFPAPASGPGGAGAKAQ